MSSSYADGLSEYTHKGVLGIPEIFDNTEDVKSKSEILADWISEAKHVVVHTGAGISTSAGIPDFRGPDGVWTLEKKGLKPAVNISFDNANPTVTHMVLKALVDANKVQYIVSQNIDGLHLKSGIPRSKLSELHGNMFIEQCDICKRQFVMPSATKSVGQKPLGGPCKASKRPCRGKLCDTILDWEHNLPERDLNMAEMHSSLADLNICLGTTLQIIPSGNLPLKNLKSGGKVVICNLQPTKHNKKAHLVINSYVDEVFKKVAKRLGIEIPVYDEENDPSKSNVSIEWTISSASEKNFEIFYRNKCKSLKTGLKNIKVKNANIKKCKYDVKEVIPSVKQEMGGSDHR